MSVTLAVANGDLHDNARGSAPLISGRDKLAQDIAEALLSEYDYSRDANGKLVSMRVTGPGAKALIQGEVSRILTRLQKLQDQDGYITDSERIAGIGTVQVKQLNETDYQFHATVVTLDGGSLTVTDAVSYRPVRLAHTYPSGIFPLT